LSTNRPQAGRFLLSGVSFGLVYGEYDENSVAIKADVSFSVDSGHHHHHRPGQRQPLCPDRHKRSDSQARQKVIGAAHLGSGKAAAMRVAMQIIHHKHPEFRYGPWTCIMPANVDDFGMILCDRRST
jgi:hypothetical protein